MIDALIRRSVTVALVEALSAEGNQVQYSQAGIFRGSDGTTAITARASEVVNHEFNIGCCVICADGAEEHLEHLGE